MATVDYKEVQKFDQWWMKGLLVLSSLMMLAGIAMGYFQKSASLSEEQARELLTNYLLIMIAVGVGVALLIVLVLSHRLEIDINRFRLRYRFYPLVSWKEVTPGQLKGFEIKNAGAVWKFGGLGLRYNPFIGQWAYLVKGRYAMVLHFTSGRSLTMSTAHPEELQHAMEAFLAKKE